MNHALKVAAMMRKYINNAPACERCGQHPGEHGVWRPEHRCNVQVCGACLTDAERSLPVVTAHE